MELQELIAQVESASPDDPLDRLVTATVQQQHLADLGDQLLDHFVQAARQDGCSWAQIGEALGVSKQAAQQRHGASDKPRGGLIDWVKGRNVGRGRRRFERFTKEATRTVVKSQELARDMHHEEIGPEHVLIALLSDGGETAVARLLAGWSITRDEVVAAVDADRPRGESPPRGHIPFTSGAKKALELSLREAMALGHNFISAEHILLGLVRTDEGVTAEIMRKHEVTLPAARDAVREALAGLTEGEPDPG